MPVIAESRPATKVRIGSVGLPPRRKSQPRLFFPRETQALWTPFRSRVLHLLYRTAAGELQARLRSVEVRTWSHPGEEDSDILLLSMVADAEMTELDQVGDTLLEAVRKESESWTEEERQDYSKRIYFEFVPLEE